jgi:tRNA G18 (ribose-2'-O)-methylase SpoU
VKSQRAEQPIIVALLDNIRSIWNVGAMFRIADGCGISHLHLCGMTATPEHPRVVKTALGAEESVPWSYHRNGVEAARDMLAAGCRLWALESSAGALPLTRAPALLSERPTALVVGNEKAGIDPGILALCEQAYYIPMVGRKGSLNVAVAFGIAAYSLCFA